MRLGFFHQLAVALCCLAQASAGLHAADAAPPIRWIKMVPVESQSIASVGYHGRTKTLQVTFHDQRTYRYRNVPAAVYKKFLAAPSKGRFFDTQIRSHYAYSRVDPPKAAAHPN